MTLTNEQLNELQNVGLISDLCVTQDDIAPSDLENAIKWLNERSDYERTK